MMRGVRHKYIQYWNNKIKIYARHAYQTEEFAESERVREIQRKLRKV